MNDEFLVKFLEKYDCTYTMQLSYKRTLDSPKFYVDKLATNETTKHCTSSQKNLPAEPVSYGQIT